MEDNAFFKIGDRVQHIREPDAVGTIKQVDEFPHRQLGVVGVAWDDQPDVIYMHWASRLRILEEEEHATVR